MCKENIVIGSEAQRQVGRNLSKEHLTGIHTNNTDKLEKKIGIS